MSLCNVVSVLLLVNSCCSLISNGGPYRIPRATVEVLHPRGFRISVKDTPGTSAVGFQANINQRLGRHIQGRFAGNIEEATDGKWTYEEHNARLKIGDKLYYRINITHNKLRYGTAGEDFYLVKELPGKPTDIPYMQAAESQHQIYLPQPTTTPPDDSFIYEIVLLNCSQSLSALQAELAAVKKINKQLTTLVERDSGTKKLTLSGRIPPTDDPTLTVTFIIREKLELNPDIVSAVRKSDKSIVFEVATLPEKLEILDVAKDKLRNSRILIS